MVLGGDEETQKKIIGPLYGQLTFKAVEDCKKIIVISKIPEAYEVVKEIVAKLDTKTPAEVPMVVTLKYADCEDLCEQLNAIFNESGTASYVWRSQKGLSTYKKDETTGEQKIDIKNNNENNSDANKIIGPWSKGRSRTGEEMPISNLIGKLRFIPVYRSKAVMVLCPWEYQEYIKDIIHDLDKPVKQVLIKAIVMDVDHDMLMKLGSKFSSNPLAIGAAGVNGISGLADLAYVGVAGKTFTVDTGLDISILVDLLKSETDGRIINQPSIWTKDNEEAAFFNGMDVAFIENEVTGEDTGVSTKSNFEYRPVGVNLQVRPNITPENDVDMTINLTIAQIDDQLINQNIATNRFNTYTHSIVKDAQTIMISGIIFQKDVEINTKVPLLGDIPLLGGLFRHKEQAVTNRELIAFVTPYVFNGDKTKPESEKVLKENVDKMNKVTNELNETIDKEFPPEEK